MNRKQFVLSLFGVGFAGSIPATANTVKSDPKRIKFFLSAADNLRSMRQDCEVMAHVHEKALATYKVAAVKHWGYQPTWLKYTTFGDCSIVSYKFTAKSLNTPEDMYDLNTAKDSELKHNGFRPTCLNQATDAAMGVLNDPNLTQETKSKEIGKIMEGVMHFGAIPWYRSYESLRKRSTVYLADI